MKRVNKIKHPSILVIAGVLMIFCLPSLAQTDAAYYQTEENEATITAQLFTAIPISDFGSTNLNNENATFAGLGFGAGIHIGHKTPNVQWLVQFNYFSNPVRTDELERDLQARDSIEYNISAKNYQARNIMVGAAIPVIRTERFNFSVGALAGMTFTSRPQMDYSLSTPTGPLRFTESKANDVEFSYSMQMQCVYDLPSGIFIHGQLTYLASHTGYQYRTSKGGQLGQETVHQPFYILGVSIGAGFSF